MLYFRLLLIFYHAFEYFSRFSLFITIITFLYHFHKVNLLLIIHLFFIHFFISLSYIAERKAEMHLKCTRAETETRSTHKVVYQNKTQPQYTVTLMLTEATKSTVLTRI